MNDTVLTKAMSQVQVQDDTRTTVSAEIDRVIIGGIAAFTGVVGLWSIACIASAMFQAGGPLNLVVGYFQALAGM